jgi:hypothetical protein
MIFYVYRSIQRQKNSVFSFRVWYVHFRQETTEADTMSVVLICNSFQIQRSKSYKATGIPKYPRNYK